MNLLFLDDHFLRQHLHCVDALCIFFLDLINLSEGSFADKLENLEIIRPNLFFVDLFKMHFQMNLAGHVIVSHSAGHKRKPPLQTTFVVFQIKT